MVLSGQWKKMLYSGFLLWMATASNTRCTISWLHVSWSLSFYYGLFIQFTLWTKLMMHPRESKYNHNFGDVIVMSKLFRQIITCNKQFVKLLFIYLLNNCRASHRNVNSCWLCTSVMSTPPALTVHFFHHSGSAPSLSSFEISHLFCFLYLFPTIPLFLSLAITLFLF